MMNRRKFPIDKMKLLNTRFWFLTVIENNKPKSSSNPASGIATSNWYCGGGEKPNRIPNA